MIATDMMTFIKSDLAVFGVGVALVFCIMLYLFFQNIWFVLLPLANAFLTTAFTASILGFDGLENQCYFLQFYCTTLNLNDLFNSSCLGEIYEVSKNESSVADAMNKTLNQMVMPMFFCSFDYGNSIFIFNDG